MIKKICSFILASAAALVLFQGCCFSGEVSKNLILTEKDAGKTFRVHIGDIVFVKLSENPTTGYQWKELPAETGKKVLKFSGEDYLPHADEKLCGAPGTKSFGYLVASAGKRTIALESRRSWMKSSKDTKKIVFHIIAEQQVK